MSVIFNTLAEVLDTHVACRDKHKPSLRYINCEEGLEPNYPMPAIPIKVTWGGVFWRWLTIVECLAPNYKVLRYWEENSQEFKEY